ncbi:MAG: M48 family metallopeptidase [Hyphomicrobium sp.]|nr:M48 family metallopeptidase [Hyphomicrobium sp.]
MAKARASASSKKTIARRASGRLEDISAQFEVRRHPGARRLTLRVSRTSRAVVVTIPVQCDLDEAGSFLNRHIDWVRERLDSLPDPVPFRDGVAMPLRGEPHTVVFTGCKRSRIVTRVAIPGHRPEIRVPGSLDMAPRRLRDWLFEEARRDLAERVSFHSKTLRVKSTKIAVRDQTSRWGSCSSTGVLSFSWRLVLSPPHVLDYVAAHEVAHLAEMNHGPRFWALVKKADPEYQTAKKWLLVYGLDLHRYGATADV